MNTEAAKWIALIIMIVDHAAAVLSPALLWPRLLGRIAFPIYAFLIAYNAAHRATNIQRYIVRLLTWAIPAQAAFLLLGWDRLNILITLAVALAVCSVPRWHSWLLPVLAAGALGEIIAGHRIMEYGCAGILLVLTVHALVKEPKDPLLWTTAAYAYICLAAINQPPAAVAMWAVAGLGAIPILYAAAHAPLPRLPRQWRWTWYAAYPLHLTVLALLAAGGPT